jgi:hypothetical protein
VSAAKLLGEARRSGVRLRLADGRKIKVAGNPDPDLLDRLRRHKPELIEIMTGDRCRHCGEPMAWPGPAGVVHADGTAEHHECRTWAAASRVLAGVVGTSDEGELIVRGEPPP